jgi:hypothetical protein
MAKSGLAIDAKVCYNKFAEGSLTISDIIPLFTAILSRYANLNGGYLFKEYVMDYGGNL